MKKWIFTFGSGQLEELGGFINPMDMMLVVEDDHEGKAREKVMDSFIGKKFCTSYPYEKYVDEFREKYGMFECNFDKLIKFMEENQSTDETYYELKKDFEHEVLNANK